KRKGLAEEEAEVLRARRGFGDVVPGAIDRGRRRLHLGKPHTALGVAETVAHDRIGGGGIAQFDRRRLRWRHAVADPARQRAQAGFRERVVGRGIYWRPAALAAIEGWRLLHHPTWRFSVSGAREFPPPITR